MNAFYFWFSCALSVGAVYREWHTDACIFLATAIIVGVLSKRTDAASQPTSQEQK